MEVRTAPARDKPAWRRRRGCSSREEEEAERLYEEAVGQAIGEQQIVQGLDPEGADGHTPTPIEDVTNLGEEQPPPSEESPRAGSS